MRLTRRSGAQSERGFAFWEMMVLLAVLALFLVGVIFLSSKGIESLQPKNADRQLRAKGEALMDRLEALTREAVVIYAFSAPNMLSMLFLYNEEILFAADLDGDATKREIDSANRSGAAAAGGIEDVSVTQPGNRTVELVAGVSGVDSGDEEVVLARILDARSQPAFRVEYEAGKNLHLSQADLGEASPDLRVRGLHIFLKLEDRGKKLEIDRAFKLKNPAPVRAAPKKGQIYGPPVN